MLVKVKYPRHVPAARRGCLGTGVAHVLRIHESLLRNRDNDDKIFQQNITHFEPINEMLQIVHYAKGQQYIGHHDFSYPKEAPDQPHRTVERSTSERQGNDILHY
jgi:hypothetical protein